MMALGVVVLVGGMIVVALTAVIFLVWGIASGQFKDVEEAKYKMLEDNEPQPWPHQKGDQS
jgi:cbb3-type cytochrome oxidase maturation protein